MMSELTSYLALGFGHITTLDAADHIVFLVALAAIYRLRDWRQMLWVVTAFTVGHSITLALAVTGLVAFPMALVEFLIPVTIVATAIENVIVREGAQGAGGARYRPLFAGVFGLVHGAGFAEYLRSMFVEQVAIPLLGFNLGIEIGQVVVLVAVGAALGGLDRLLGLVATPGRPDFNPVRLRTVGISAVIALLATQWAWERSPW